MDLTLKDIKLPKDPLATDQEDSDVSSKASERERQAKRLSEIKDPNYDIPQNDTQILRGTMFADQMIDH